VKDAEAALIGHALGEESMRAAAEACYLKARPLDNTDFIMNWRKQMARPYVLRALEELKSQN
jgi:CO/xanthine dehydrogenase FAD-binding subunit